ncbi:LIVCS family branched-chain amino acid:cation transporter [Clostridium acetobutylicum]|uniref:Branched-chain amino acid transport system carrier protein n=1 Tax=Clostridium acetobutylicum (strain ATCC 824 / DSM 792 / JCM 1419 / IAM 19013 / LMG 5710 / NBRC 13948 / NRRL B-527 / VKM B-1787 / 2291 / W) TaxID=272562 RepID=Q97IN0_CLOAB|nr:MULTISPECIES: branched-chain amino acid transport system II carrier protein [Clostridium]AAK79577.1 Branched-chain amino acid permease [Clostridium acetobutylicum ATCC 824]ADZ20662.1 Branched-chain amino acid permease [Clostridium acetobutylicum EA 2018]AEI33112.1 branched-chain amino acid permease [Clostridium acetobutylicum DSM 1731]AWV79983.1 branched-chain amino acid transport system II carrier protein [Clostridium acetobutylicum]MBC2394030.1 branched-chain amino acid transport system I
MKELSKKNTFFVGLLLFSMFFGAGNLIFPPFLGQLSGKYVWIAFSGFIITAVGLPILAVIIVSKSKGLFNLAAHVNPTFALIFTALIYLSIGPFLGIPRTGSLAFTMGVSPFLPKSLASSPIPLLIYTLIYFSIAFWLSLTPSKLVNRLGKVLTPILLVLIFIVFIKSLITPIGAFGTPKGDYSSFPFFKGFSDGYLTMDVIAALNFGIVISSTLKSMGVKSEKSIISYSIKAGLIVGAMLIIIYAMLSYVGASSRTISLNAQNGGEILTSAASHLFGHYGIIILGVIFSLACLNTATGLITSCSEYFTTLTKNKLSYKTWVFIFAFLSMLFANIGLTKILSISVPVLNAIYPMAIILMIMFLLSNLFKGSKYVYILGMSFTGIFSILDSLNQTLIKSSTINSTFNLLPLYTKGLGWIVPALIGLILGYLIHIFKKSHTA